MGTIMWKIAATLAQSGLTNTADWWWIQGVTFVRDESGRGNAFIPP